MILVQQLQVTTAPPLNMSVVTGISPPPGNFSVKLCLAPPGSWQKVLPKLCQECRDPTDRTSQGSSSSEHGISQLVSQFNAMMLGKTDSF